MKLIGSIASPFVRRVRLMLLDKDYEFEKITVFTEEGQQRLKEVNPIKRVPVLIDGDKTIWDSNLISDYLGATPADMDSKLELAMVSDMCDAGIQLFLLRKFETDSEDTGQFSKNNLARIKSILEYFSKNVPGEWNPVAQWLFCTLDWFSFRNVYDWENESLELVKFHSQFSEADGVALTDPMAQS